MEVKAAKREDVWVNLTKIWCVCIVVIQHCNMADCVWLNWFPEYTDTCVQVMFIFSGYYLVRNQSLQSEEKGSRYIRHLVGMVLIWEIIYFFTDLCYTDKTASGWLYQYMTQCMDSFVRLSSGHLWYIQNLTFVIMILYCLKKERYGWKEVVFFLIAASFFPVHVIRTAAGVFFGGYLAQNKKEAAKGKAAVLLIAAIAFSACMITLYYIEVSFSYFIYLSSIQLLLNLAAMAFACWAIDMDELYPINAGAAGYYIRKIATNIYLLHVMFIQIAMRVTEHHAVWGETKYSFIAAMYTTIFSIAAGVVLIWLSRRKRFQWIKYLY